MTHRAPGRPRSERSRRAILDAALAEVAERGYANTTVAGIAKRAGTGKQTVYRWWSSKGEVVLDAMLALARSRIAVPDEGALEADLQRFLEATFRQRGQRPALVGVMAEAVLDPGFGLAFRERFLGQRRNALRTIFERAQARGEIRSNLDVELALDVVFGVLWYRLLTESGPLTPAAARDLSSFVVRAIGA